MANGLAFDAGLGAWGLANSWIPKLSLAFGVMAPSERLLSSELSLS